MHQKLRFFSFISIGLLTACGSDVVVGDHDSGVAQGGGGGSQSAGGGAPTGPGSTPACAPGAELETLYEVNDESAVGLALDAEHVFVSIRGEGGDKIVAVDKQDGSAVTIAESQRPWGLVANGDAIFWIDDSTRLWRVDRDGSNRQLLLESQSLTQLAVDDSHVYVTQGASLLRIPEGGGPAVVFASGQGGPDSIAIDDEAVYWLNVGTIDDAEGEIMKKPKGGGAVTTLAEGQRARALGLPGLTIDDSHVYWAAADDGAIRRIRKLGGPVETLLEGVEAQALSIRDGWLYFNAPWVDDASEPRRLGRLPAAGGSVTPILTTAQYNPWGIAVDARHVYWSSYVTTGPLTRACR